MKYIFVCIFLADHKISTQEIIIAKLKKLYHLEVFIHVPT